MVVPKSVILSQKNFPPNEIQSNPGYNDIGLYDTSPIESDILWYQIILHY
jgi:hypothetical protein